MSSSQKPLSLPGLFGIGKVFFRELGGGESSPKAERADWGPDPRERFEIGRVIPRKEGRSN